MIYMHLFKIRNFFLDAGPAPEGGYIPFVWMVKYYQIQIQTPERQSTYSCEINCCGCTVHLDKDL